MPGCWPSPGWAWVGAQLLLPAAAPLLAGAALEGGGGVAGVGGAWAKARAGTATRAAVIKAVLRVCMAAERAIGPDVPN
jgi:hypothetical protein